VRGDRAYNGCLGELLPEGSGAQPSWSAAKAPIEAESLLDLGVQKGAKFAHCLKTVHSESLLEMEISW